MNTPKIISVPKAYKNYSHIPFGSSHPTTMNVGFTNVSKAFDVAPGTHIKMQLDGFAQLAPMQVPTMGHMNLFSRAFFVPYRFVWKHWESWRMRKAATPSGLPLGIIPTIPQYMFNDMFYTKMRPQTTWQNYSDCLCYEAAGESVDHVDWEFETPETVPDISGQHVIKKVVFTPLGNVFFQMLNALGYNLECEAYTQPTADRKEYPALPLLSLVKVFRDYYSNPNFDYELIDGILDSDLYWPDYPTTDRFSLKNPNTLFEVLHFCAFGWYDSDLFTSAWKNPERTGYSATTSSEDRVLNITTHFGGYGSDVYTENVHSAQNIDGYSQRSQIFQERSDTGLRTSITQYSLNVLQAIQRMTLRMSAAGSRYVDQLAAETGIRLDNSETRRSTFVGTAVMNLNISRVDATAAGESPSGAVSSLGDFTGRGTMNGNGRFEYVANKDDHGIFLVISHIVPVNEYYQGDLPTVHKKEWQDFFNADLENVGYAPIPSSLLFADYRVIEDSEADMNAKKSIFGYAPNYFQYKVDFSRLTGNFRLPSRNEHLKAFQLFRELDPINAGSSSASSLTSAFMKFDLESIYRWNRIFLDQTGFDDPFIVHFVFTSMQGLPMTSLGNALPAQMREHGDELGQNISVRPGGQYF